MSGKIDCLFIGNNEMAFEDYETEIRKMGSRSGAYRDLNMDFLRYNNKLYTPSEMFNLFYLNSPDARGGGPVKPLNLAETFSAAIAYLGTYLHRRGFSFDYVNSFQGGKRELAEKLAEENILTIAVITTLYVSVFPILEIVEFIRKHNRTARIVVGGPFVTTQFRAMETGSLLYLFNSVGADVYVNSSQGEAALVEIIRALKAGGALDRIPNIYYRSTGGDGYTSTPRVEENNDLSQNMVNWDLFNNRVGEFASIRTSISCPFSCAFCGFPEHAGPYRTAEVDAVMEELDGLSRIKELKSINFIDDTFNVPKSRFKKILRLMARKNYPFKWNSHFRCQFADRETVELMKESGCEGVFLGIESGSDQILRNMNKAATVEKFLKGIALLKEYDILTYGSFIVGFPGETDETVRDTLQFIEEGGLDFFRAQLWYCETITPIWRKRDEYKLTGSNYEWSHATMDSKRASDLVEEMFVSIDNPVWVPKFNFEFGALFQLMHRGFTIREITDFIRAFSRGIKAKLLDPSRKEIDFDTASQLKTACLRRENTDEPGTGNRSGGGKIDRSTVGFDF